MYVLYERGCDWLGNRLSRFGWVCIKWGMRLSGVPVDEWLAEQTAEDAGE